MLWGLDLGVLALVYMLRRVGWSGGEIWKGAWVWNIICKEIMVGIEVDGKELMKKLWGVSTVDLAVTEK